MDKPTLIAALDADLDAGGSPRGVVALDGPYTDARNWLAAQWHLCPQTQMPRPLSHRGVPISIAKTPLPEPGFVLWRRA